ncbi:MAG: hypothetical protein HZB50_04190 [Chloroflexi bacterium]|nr:hypothetical protein [Chloroflexota bacterium]
MRLFLTMTVTAIGSLLFGLAYLLFPERILSIYNIVLEPSNQWVPRYFGANLLGIAAMCWYGRSAKSGIALNAMIKGIFATTIIGFAVSIFEIINGAGNLLVWSTVTIYFLLSLGFGDFVFRTPPPE